ncbi:MAG: hypothetical protein QM528_02830 [Phycisphaerales bacterium]|nr:hypothetical protein [Phycisphaerales bacterium]
MEKNISFIGVTKDLHKKLKDHCEKVTEEGKKKEGNGFKTLHIGAFIQDMWDKHFAGGNLGNDEMAKFWGNMRETINKDFLHRVDQITSFIVEQEKRYHLPQKIALQKISKELEDAGLEINEKKTADVTVSSEEVEKLKNSNEKLKDRVNELLAENDRLNRIVKNTDEDEILNELIFIVSGIRMFQKDDSEDDDPMKAKCQFEFPYSKVGFRYEEDTAYWSHVRRILSRDIIQEKRKKLKNSEQWKQFAKLPNPDPYKK